MIIGNHQQIVMIMIKIGVNWNWLYYIIWYDINYFIVILDSNNRSPNAYEDDYTFDGDKEDSDTESNGPTSAKYF